MFTTNNSQEWLKVESSIHGHLEPANYQVFLSFRGPDTRQGFVDCLYHFLIDAGIRVFKDDEDQPLGEKIEKILEAIENSMICIPVFSKNYASSKWCLRELARMIELNKKIIPIFYDVTPDDVKLKTSLYVDALRDLHGKMERRKFFLTGKSVYREIEQWKKALQTVGTFSGRELRGTGYGEFSKSILREVSNVLKIKEKLVTDHLVGLDAYVDTILNLLDIEARDVRYLGIHGMGGIGKTTLAKVIFNQLSPRFEYCSFLSDTRESSQQKGIVHLQKQLLDELGCKSTLEISDGDEGIKAMTATSRQKKVLIVLDDVNQKEQIDKLAGNSNWFAPGSRIIVTSRDKRVLTFEGTSSQSKSVSTLEMQELNFDCALQLFSRHAFGTDPPPVEYKDLAEEAVSVSGFLPLSVEIIGSLLRDKHKHDWKKKIKALGEIPHKNVQQKLMISYDELDHRTKEMFLDIACFLINAEVPNAIYMWEACNFRPESGMEDLISLSLVKIVDNKFWMHDHLKDLGRDIVCLENPADPGKRSRLWKDDEVLRILEAREGTEKVVALCLSDVHISTLEGSFNLLSRRQDFTEESFKLFRNLRILKLWANKFKGCSLNLVGDFKGLLPSLRWLSWHDCPPHLKATNLNLVNLVVLDLSYSDITEYWNGWSKIEIGNNLKVLDLSYCCGLTQVPDLSKYRSLEKLVLQGCWRLIQIDSSIGMLNTLKHLNVKDCYGLQGLPEELCSLENLEEILVKGVDRSFTLPRGTGNLKSLANLELVELGIRELPASICQLKKLTRLSLRSCWRIQELPDSLGDLESLVELDISYTSIGELPESIGSLRGLKVTRSDDGKIDWTAREYHRLGYMLTPFRRT